MIKPGRNFIAFFERPIAGALGAVTIAIWIAMISFMRRGNTPGPAAVSASAR